GGGKTPPQVIRVAQGNDGSAERLACRDRIRGLVGWGGHWFGWSGAVHGRLRARYVRLTRSRLELTRQLVERFLRFFTLLERPPVPIRTVLDEGDPFPFESARQQDGGSALRAGGFVKGRQQRSRVVSVHHDGRPAESRPACAISLHVVLQHRRIARSEAIAV